ncbi:MAG: hypothetical protein [Circular genetic element sp.]|nr:MAG: hypothetical protein [Circular genetic element sp.]
MAKRNYSMTKRNVKIQPAVDTMYFRTPNVPGNGTQTFYIDLSQCASLVNRRFYRQGINWATAGFKFLTNPSVQASFVMSKLPNTWVTSNAWEKAFRAWNKQQMEAVDDSGSESAVARFRDFKVHADEGHVTASFANNLLPYDIQTVPQPYGTGEWDESLIVVPNLIADASGSTVNPFEYKLHMTGVNNFSGSRGILEGYAASRAYPQSPDPVSPDVQNDTNWFKQMFDVGNDDTEILDNATNRNDDLPYPQADYPGGAIQAPTMQLHDLAKVSGTTVGGVTRMKGGTFPCGLIRIDIENNDEAAQGFAFTIDLVPGTHRGYMCEPMTEM